MHWMLPQTTRAVAFGEQTNVLVTLNSRPMWSATPRLCVKFKRSHLRCESRCSDSSRRKQQEAHLLPPSAISNAVRHRRIIA